MTRIAVSGHRGLPPDVVRLIDAAARTHLASFGPELVGISCLADGADQLFARAVLDVGGVLEVVIPARQYRDGLPAECHADYDTLLGRASAVRELAFTESTSESHMEASRAMLAGVDELLAIWDGQPARGYGGTADVVALAREHGLPVHVIWPEGARRD